MYKDMTIKELVEARDALDKNDTGYRKNLAAIEWELENRMVVA